MSVWRTIYAAPRLRCTAALRQEQPDLYRLSNTDECVLTDGDWEEVRAVWDGYEKKIRSKFD